VFHCAVRTGTFANFWTSNPDYTKKKIHVKYPNSTWSTIWENVTSTPLSRRDACHMARGSCTISSHSIRLQTTVACVSCDDTETILHWLITCTVTLELWECIRQRTAALPRTDPTLRHPKLAISSCGHHMANIERNVTIRTSRHYVPCVTQTGALSIHTTTELSPAYT